MKRQHGEPIRSVINDRDIYPENQIKQLCVLQPQWQTNLWVK